MLALRAAAGTTETYHRFVIKGEVLHLPQGIGGCSDFIEDDPGLASEFQRLASDNVNDFPELREDSIQRFFQLCKP